MLVRMTLVLLTAAWLMSLSIPSRGQPPQSTDQVDAKDAAARQKILESREWRRMLRTFEEWSSVQSVHTPEQMAALKARLDEQTAGMSSMELEDFLCDMQDRLDVLMSEQAKAARDWLSAFTVEARQQRVSPQGEFTDVFDITVSQLRQELRQLEQRRAQSAAAHTQFNRLREQNVASSLARRRAQEQAAQESRNVSRSAAVHHDRNTGSQFAPRRDRDLLRRDRQLYLNSWGGVSMRFEL